MSSSRALSTRFDALTAVGDTKGSMFSREIRREAQEALNFYGFDTGVPDGIFGTQTQITIRNFQTSKGGQITGEFSRATMGLLLQSYRTDRDKIRPTLVASGVRKLWKTQFPK